MYSVFVHSHKFRKINNEYYSPGGLPNDVLSRYVNFYGNIKVIARVYEENNNQKNKKYSKITNPQIELVNCLDKKNDLKNIIKNSERVIVRIPSAIGFICYHLAKKYKKEIVVEMVACPWDGYWNHSLKGKIVAPFAYLITKMILKDAQNVLYVTKEFLQRRYPTKGYNVSCSNVSLPEFEDGVIEKRLKKIDAMKQEKIVLGTLAAINVKAKGQQYVIEALGKLKKMGITNLEYQLIGSGDKSYLEKIAIKNHVEDKVIFLGSLTHDKVFEWLDTIDIYIQPSNQEGLPRALIEAMSRGCPAIGSTTGGIPELLDKKAIFKRKKVEQLRKLILEFSQDKELLKQMAKCNYEESKEYSHAKLEKIRRDFFMRLVKKEKESD